MDADSSPSPRPVTPTARLSKTPSWIMLGFLLGVASVLALWAPWKKPTSLAPPPVVASAEPAKPLAPPQLTTIEAVFEAWGRHAVWEGDTTEVALDAGSGTFSEFYEVRRRGETLYFRSLPRLTRRILRHGPPPPEGCPLQFTETEEQYREWIEHGRKERR